MPMCYRTKKLYNDVQTFFLEAVMLYMDHA